VTLWIIAIALLSPTGELIGGGVYGELGANHPRLFASEKVCEAALEKITLVVQAATPEQRFAINCMPVEMSGTPPPPGSSS
jgi:hypothetical protein